MAKAAKATHIFNFSHQSKEDGKTYAGTFSCKRLSIADMQRVRVHQAQLNGGMHYDDETPGYGVDAYTNGISLVISRLKTALVTTPEWWDLEEITDMELVLEVHTKLIEYYDTFRPKSNETVSGSSQESNTVTDAGAKTPGMVGGKVLDALAP
jgi:hypothetical protein